MIVVIICGGSGSRLWPMSRQFDPKTFLQLNNGISLLQETFLRAASLSNITNIITVTNEKLFLRIQDEYNQINQNNIPCSFILEPYGKNTASAIINACLYVKKYFNNELLLILPADHLVQDISAFKNAVAQASIIANNDYIVTFGITPTYAETGYGYIQVDNDTIINGGFGVKEFTEKPNEQIAMQYVKSGDYLWNSGMFLATSNTLLAEFNIYASQLLHDNNNCFDSAKVDTINTNNIVYLNNSLFDKIKNISIDYALLEQSNKVAVMPCMIEWSDIGSWLSVANTLDKDSNNNALIGETITHNTTNCLLYSTNRIIATTDVKDLIIVDTPDALLVANKNYSQNVKHIFEKLKNEAHKTVDNHQTVHRPWGTYTIIEDGMCYKIKRIKVKPQASLSLQLHHHRSEHWVVIEGIASIVNGDTMIELKANESTYIPINTKHRLSNTTNEDVVIIEVQCGSYLGEDDIVRFDDIYGRSSESV